MAVNGAPVPHHLLLCATPTKPLCCPDPALGAASWDALKRLVRELGLEEPGRPGGIVLRSKADCLRICSAPARTCRSDSACPAPLDAREALESVASASSTCFR